jgi:hypothetical protein
MSTGMLVLAVVTAIIAVVVIRDVLMDMKSR